MKTIVNLVLIICQLAYVINAFTLNFEELNQISKKTPDEPLETPLASPKFEYNQLDRILVDLDEIKDVLESNRIEDKIRRLAQECVDAILSRNAQLAYKKLKQIGDPTKINWIVRKVYDSNDRNFDLIADFCDEIDNPEVILRTYEALGYELSKNDDDLFKLIDKLSDFEEKYPKNNVDDFIKRLEIQFVTDYVNIPNYIIPKINEQKRLDARILGYEIIQKNVRRDNDSHFMKLAYGLNQTMDNPSFKNLDVELRNKANEIKESLPACVKNVYFGDKVHIKTIKHDAYIQSQENTKPKETFFVKILDDAAYVAFINKDDEYLRCSPEIEDIAIDYTIYIGKSNSGNKWSIEVVGDNCFLKNTCNANGGKLYSTDDGYFVTSDEPKNENSEDKKYLFALEHSNGDDN